MYEIEFSKKSENQLIKLEKLIQQRIVNSLQRIKFRPFSFIKRKQGSPHYILRVGNYRVILKIDKSKHIMFVLELGPRGRIYDI